MKETTVDFLQLPLSDGTKPVVGFIMSLYDVDGSSIFAACPVVPDGINVDADIDAIWANVPDQMTCFFSKNMAHGFIQHLLAAWSQRRLTERTIDSAIRIYGGFVMSKSEFEKRFDDSDSD